MSPSWGLTAHQPLLAPAVFSFKLHANAKNQAPPTQWPARHSGRALQAERQSMALGGELSAADAQRNLATAPMAASVCASDASDDGAPCTVECQPGELPRVVFRAAPGHRHDEVWQERAVRAAPTVPGASTGPMAYYNSSKTTSNSNVLQVLLRDHGYERAESMEEAWSIFWCAGQVDPMLLSTFLPHQKINKFPKATVLTLKANLWTSVKAMQAKHGTDHFGFMPPTFVFPREIKAYERHLREWLAAPPAGEDDAGAPSPVWIFKPAAAYCGSGIWLHRPDRAALTEAMAASKGDGAALLTDEMHQHKGVVSTYIDPPFLLDGLKSDIRLYVLVTSFHPLTVYLYGEGLARFATERYDTSALDERCGHLTNYSLNKHSDKFVRNVNDADDGAGSKWSLTAFQRRLVQEWGEERAALLWRQVDDLVVKTMVAAEPTIAPWLNAYLPAAARGEPVRTCFQVFGFDVMLDGAGKPWLLEVNLDPALRTESPLDLKIKSSMLVDLLNVVGMPLPPASVASGAEAAGGAAEASANHDVSAGDGAVPQTLFEKWRAGAPPPTPAEGDSLTDVERWALHLVNAEFRRSQAGGWRRLFPSARSAEYHRFLDPERTMHRLPFDV